MSAINLNGGPVKGKCIYQYRAVESEGSTEIMYNFGKIRLKITNVFKEEANESK